MKNPVIKKVFLKPDDPRRPESSFKKLESFNPRWIWPQMENPDQPCVVLFRRTVRLAKTLKTRIHLNADQRFDLFINGELLARGPELGDPDHRMVHSYQLTLPPGAHTILARCWWIGGMAPLAQMTPGHGGFMFLAEGAADRILTTGRTEWEWCVLSAYRFNRPWITWGAQGDTFIDGAGLPADGMELRDLNWTAAPVREKKKKKPGERDGSKDGFCPSSLPDMYELRRDRVLVRHAARLANREEGIAPLDPARHDTGLAGGLARLMTSGNPLTVPPGTCVQWLLDFDDYCCAYPRLRTSGGAGGSIQLHWAESLYHPPHSDNRKGNRDEVDGKIIHADGDTFYPDGRDLSFDLLWWRAGRYVQLLIETKEQPLTLTELSFFESRYPLTVENRFASSDPDCERIIPLIQRTLEMCMHETYMDCPYYEQLQYVGDTRTEALTTYVISRDDRLPRKALQCFDRSRVPSGLTQSRYPSTWRQMIPTFSLWWVCMVRDYLLWRGDPDFVASLLPGVRAVLDGFEAYRGDDGLLSEVAGWNFVDWSGRQTQADDGPVNLHYLLALQAAAEVEAQAGLPAMASLFRRRAQAVRTAVIRTFWNPQKQIFADDRKRHHFSEHMQCLAVLAGACNATRLRSVRAALLKPNRMDKATIYFMHYLFEALPALDAMPYFFERMKTWTVLPEQGFRTLPETPEPARSDCHAWGAHPLYHYYTKLLGITPASSGFATVRIEPRPCHLRKLSGTLPHPKGLIRVSLDLDKGRADISLPKGVPGVFIWNSRRTKIEGGAVRKLILPLAARPIER